MLFRRQAPKVSERHRLFETEAMPHADALYGAALRLTRSPRDAEDLVQDTLMKAFTHFDRYSPGTNCRAWLFRILTNTFINRYRRAQRDPVSLVDDEGGRPFEERATAVEASELEPRDESGTAQIERLFGDEVSAALARVPTDFRVVVLLADVYDFSYKECADILGCPIGTVMSRLYRGRRLLRSSLAEYAVESGVVRTLSDEYREQVESDRGEPIDLAAYRRAAL